MNEFTELEMTGHTDFSAYSRRAYSAAHYSREATPAPASKTPDTPQPRPTRYMPRRAALGALWCHTPGGAGIRSKLLPSRQEKVPNFMPLSPGVRLRTPRPTSTNK